VSNREEALAKVNELIENDLELVGSTAIEDKL
jgi:magnesium-transporting ATPase (P-type)